MLIAMAACGKSGSGTVKTEARQVAAFSRVELAGSGKLHIAVTPDGAQTLAMTTDDNLLPLILTDVVDGKLTIWTHEEIDPSRSLEVEIHVPKLEALKLSGAGHAKVERIAGTLFELWLTGAGTVDLTGEVTETQMHVSGAGAVHGAGLHAQKVEVNLSGVGEAEVFATEHVDVRLSGAGHVSVLGKPKVVDQHVSGVGTVDLR